LVKALCAICALLIWLFGDGRKVVESTKLPTKLSTFDSDSCFIVIIVLASFVVHELVNADAVPCNVTSASCWSETVVRRAIRISDSEIVRCWCDGDEFLSGIFFRNGFFCFMGNFFGLFFLFLVWIKIQRNWING